MVDEADVNEAMAGPPSRKKENRAASPRDRKRRRSYTPPPKSPTLPNHQASPGSPLSPVQNNKGSVVPNRVLQPENKSNSSLPGHGGVKRKHMDEPQEGGNKNRLKVSKSSTKSHINPALKKLQQLHKEQSNRKAPNLSASRNSSTSNMTGSSDITSILRKAITSQERSASSKGNLIEGNPEGEKNKRLNSESELVDAKSNSGSNQSEAKGPSPGLLQRQFARVVWEENTRLRRLIFKEIRQPEKGLYFYFSSFIGTIH